MIEVIEMGLEHLDRVCEIENKSFSMPWKRKDFEELIESEDSEYFVLLEDGFVVGVAGYTNQVMEGYINNVAVDEAFRGKGLSKYLLKALIKAGEKKGIYDFTLEVRVSNIRAIKLYEGFGFENYGIRKNFYEHPREDAYVYWRKRA